MRCRLLIIPLVVALPVVACSSSTAKAPVKGAPAANTTSSRPLGTPAPGLTFGPTTSSLPDCGRMPTPADLTAAVGVPMAPGTVTAAEACEFRGANDQTKTVELGLLADPADQAVFTDLQSSLGPSKPLNDPAVANVMVGPDSTVYTTFNGVIYTVLTNVTGGTPADQVPLSLAVLKKWLKL